MRIEEVAARTQARIDSGFSDYRWCEQASLGERSPIDILEIDNTAVRLEQIENLKRLKEGDVMRLKCRKHGGYHQNAWKTKEGNLLELAVKLPMFALTLGEISYACEKIVGRYKAIIRTISGVYSSGK